MTLPTSTGKLEIVFSGVSTHFRNGVVAGIPHRAVLPDASHFFTDYVSIKEDRFLYYLNPHFAYLYTDATNDLTVPGLITNGYIHSGIRLRVGNGKAWGNLNEADYSKNNLRTYAPGCEYSEDVVTGGRAACYFDFDYGTTQWIDPSEDIADGPWKFSITVETCGAPWLLVTPLNPIEGQPLVTKLPLGKADNATLYVNNLEFASEELPGAPWGEYDFLLHYLTIRGGVPNRIVEPTPGLQHPRHAQPSEIGVALEHLARLLLLQADNPAAFHERLRRIVGGQTPACSPAQYG